MILHALKRIEVEGCGKNAMQIIPVTKKGKHSAETINSVDV